MIRCFCLHPWLEKGAVAFALAIGDRGRFQGLLLGSAMGMASLLCLTAQAADPYLLSPRTYEALTAVHKLMDQQKYQQAVEKLTGLQKQVKGSGQQNAYEEAVVLQTLGYVYSSVEDYSRAIQAFKASLALDALPAEVGRDLRYSLAQLYIATEQYGEGIRFLEVWLKEAKAPPPEAHVLAASAYYHLEQYAKVIPPIMAAIKLAEEPQESWYQLHLAARLELKQYSQAAQVLETLIELQPKNERYWKQLAAVYSEINKDKRALAVQALAEKMGHLEGQALLYLSDFYRSLNIPYKGAQILQQALETGAIKRTTQNWERLANSWIAAREWEKGIEALSKAGQGSQKGKADLRRAQLFMELQRWDEASVALQQALRKGGLDSVGQAQFLLGQVHYEQGQLAEAIEALEVARRSPEYAKRANHWIKHLQALRKQKLSGGGAS
ncbi:tetratricopeptide repeat protein [Nitrosococcus wardiae]|uniref:tetratricopeptide repeat protein n=1 Tax=Nitrosococcus wardiae TaxID=1814290 RepID=UPI001F0FB632|nr:tetratricopeptide repeat protein [Nitrosococcus wardiae]